MKKRSQFWSHRCSWQAAHMRSPVAPAVQAGLVVQPEQRPEEYGRHSCRCSCRRGRGGGGLVQFRQSGGKRGHHQHDYDYAIGALRAAVLEQGSAPRRVLGQGHGARALPLPYRTAAQNAWGRRRPRANATPTPIHLASG